MIEAIVTRPFAGVVDGTVMPREFVKGDKITGELAEAAIRFKDAKETDESKASRQAAEDPTIAEWIGAGYKARNYKYTKSTPDEIAAAVEAEAKADADALAARKVQARTEFDAATPEQVAQGVTALKVDLTGIAATDKDAIFERLWAAMVAAAEAKA